MRFESPWLLLLILLVPIVVFIAERFRNNLTGSLRFSDKGLLDKLKPTLKIRLTGSLIYLRAVVLILVVISLARPQKPIEETKIYVEGIDIVLVLDTSTSMQAMDFEMGGRRFDRLTVVKNVVEEFIKNRPNDRIGIVAFAAQAYTVCPLTLDHDWLERNLERVTIGMVEDGTAIGAAISGAVNRIKDTKAKEKTVILLTDGQNNAGKVSPLAAAEAAKTMGIKVYTIGAGTDGFAPFPVKTMFGETVLQPVEVKIDEKLLKEIAKITGGQYFRAIDTQSLWDIYKEIDKLEKTKIEEVGYRKYDELFWMFLFPALGLLLVEIAARKTIFRRIP
jgi:Ca-activated chloride channel homolog